VAETLREERESFVWKREGGCHVSVCHCTVNKSTLVNHSKTGQTLQIMVNVGQMVK